MIPTQDRMRFRLMQGGTEVAGVDGPSLSAMRSALHYVAVYGEDGPCTLQFYTKGKRWRDVREGELESAIAFNNALPLASPALRDDREGG